MYNKLMKSLFFVLLLISASFFILSVNAQENTNEIVFSWQAQNLYPANYLGKALVTEGTPVIISLEMLRDGKLFDVSGTAIKWYMDGRFIEGGVGLKSITFYPRTRRGDSHIIKASLVVDGKTVSGFQEVPIYERQVVLESPSAKNVVSPNGSVLLTAVPYFWNVPSLSDLVISWKIQNQSVPNENKNTLFLQFGVPTTESQRNVKISSFINERRGSLEKARADLSLRIE